MATKTTKHKTGNSLDIDPGLDIPEFDFESFESGFSKQMKDEGPVKEVLGSFAKGVGSSFVKPGFIETTIRNVLPREYGSALDLGQASLGSARSLYNQAVKELKPAVGQLKQLTQQVLPKTEGILSKNIQEKLKDWSREEKSGELSEERMREMALAVELGSIFEAQAKDTDRREEANRRSDQIKDGVEQLRHRDEMGRLSEIAQNTSRLVGFNEDVTTAVYKKSLQVQLRQFYAVTELLRETKIANIKKTAQLEGVVRNTGISAGAVETTNKGSFKNKFLDGAKKGLFGAAQGFARDYVGNIHDDLSKKLTGATSSGNDLLSQINMMASMGSMGADVGMSAKGMAGDMAGSFLGDYLANKLQGKLKKHVGKIPAVQKLGAKLGYGMENAGPLLNDYLNDRNNKLGPLEPFREYLTSMLPKTGVDVTMDVASLHKSNEQAHFTNATQKSIIEVIPGLLARIQRELVITRTGKDAPLISYDYKANKFSTVEKLTSDLRAAFTGKDKQEDVKKRFDEMFKLIDKDGELDESKRERIKKQFMDKKSKGMSTDSKHIASKLNWGMDEEGEAIAKFFQKYLKTDSVGKRDPDSLQAIRRQRVLSKQIDRLTRFFEDPRADAQAMANLGQLDVLSGTGLYNTEKNSFDLDKINQGLLGGEDDTILQAGENRNPTLVEGSSRDSLNRPRRNIQKDARLAAQERRRRMQEAMTPRNQAAGAIPQQAPVEPTPVVGAEALKQTVEAMVDTAALERMMQEQIAEIKKIDPNANLLTVIEVLRSMDSRLEGGINTYSLAEDFLGPEARDRFRDRASRAGQRVKGAAGSARDAAANAARRTADAARRATSRVKDKVKSFRETTLGDVADAGLGAAKSIGSFGLDMASKLGSIGVKGAKMAGSVASTVLNKAGKTADKVADYFGDVFVEGETEPRLTRAKMKAGKYFDKGSKKVLTSLANIKGAVLDEEGMEILSADELEKSYVKGSKIRALKEIATTGAGWIGAAGSMAVKGLGTFYGGLVNVGLKAFKAGLKLLPPYDVYVKGQEKPVLTVGGFKGGLYISQKSEKTLSHPREIDGPVMDKDGNYLVTEDDIRTGLVDKNGLTVTNKAARLLGKVKNVLGAGFKALKGIAGMGKEFLVGIGQAFKDMFSGIFGLRGEYLETSRSQLDVQREILKVLVERLPTSGNKVKGDYDGDGVRNGSAEDIRRQAAEAEKQKAADQNSTEIKNQPAGGKGILGMLAGLFGKKNKGEEDEGGDTNITLGGGGDGKAPGDAGKDAGKAAKSSKWLGKGGRLARLGGGLWGATKWAGGAALSMAGLGGLGLGGLASGAASAGGAALGAAGTGLAAAGTALGAILTAPVLLTALGVAAVATAGYYGYKYLTRAQLTTLNKVRFAQYGFAEQDKEKLAIVFGLEQYLMKNVKFDKDKAYINSEKIDANEMMKPFEVSQGSSFAPQWMLWFERRFKPIFLGHVAALKGINPEIALADVDSKLKSDEKLKYLDASSMPDGPYDILESPFQDMKQLSVSSSGVKAAIELARDELQKAVKSDATSSAAKKAGAAATGAALLKSGGDGTSVSNGNAPPSGTSDEASDELKAAAGIGAAGMESSVQAGLSVSGSSNVPGDFLFTGQKGTIDALSSIRFKAYGLTEMEVPKIKDLAFLEKQVSKDVIFTKDSATYEEDVRDLLSRVKSKFGIVGPESPEGREWVNWFRCRFLPVYLNYRTLIQKATGKEDGVVGGMMLKPDQQLDVANALITTTGIDRGRKVPVWDITYTPWTDYPMNTDSASTELNIKFLTEAVKAVKAGEQKSAEKKKEAAANESAAISRGEAADTKWRVNTPVGQLAIPKDPYSLKKDREAMAEKNGYVQPAPLNSDGTGVRGMGDYIKGEAIKHPGKGTGGDINSIPEPTGNNWPGMKAMLEAVGKITGVDASTLAAMAAIESSFNPTAQAGTSSAAGLFQFVNKTWNGMIQKYGSKYGIAPNTPRTDARASALMGAEFIKENIGYLKSKLKGKDITNTDVYMAHFLGAGGATEFLNSDPNMTGDQVTSKSMRDAVAANRPVFYENKGNGRARTFAEIYKLFNQKMDRESKKAGVGSGSSSSAVAPTVTGDKTTGAPASVTPAAGDRAGGGNVAAPSASAAKNSGTAALAAANSAPAPTSAVASNVTPVVPVQTPPTTTQVGGSGGAYTAPSMPAADAPRPPIRPVPDFAGFSPQPRPTGTEISAQGDANRKAMADGIVSIGKILDDSLDVQKKILDGINVIAKNGLSGASKEPEKPKTPVANTPTSPNAQRAAKAPVSMGRDY